LATELSFLYFQHAMPVRIHPHAEIRMSERGVLLEEIEETIKSGEEFDAKYGRLGFRKNFSFGKEWRGTLYSVKQVEIYAVKEDAGFLVITVISKYF
jgi:hypothetical protein